jgi:hypothetical protein
VQHCRQAPGFQRLGTPWPLPSRRVHQLQHVGHSCLCARNGEHGQPGTEVQP